MRSQFTHRYEDIISVGNLLAAWEEFLVGKRRKPDVQVFSQHLMANVLALHRELVEKTYKHGGYHHFRVNDPKPRDIHKASVRDRLLHHALYRQLYPFFDRIFIADSYSCRRGKGTHKAMNRFRTFAYQVSRNHTRTCWVLKCDIRKFFASIDHVILKGVLASYIPDARILALLSSVIDSFSVLPEKGLPLGNLTSQLLVNVYMNGFDQFMKHRLKVRHYIRYADDFVILSHDRHELLRMFLGMEAFLHKRLRLAFHPNKVSIATLTSGVDFLGWVHFPDHRVLRTTSKRRMLRRIRESDGKEDMRAAYRGMVSHGNTLKLDAIVEHYTDVGQKTDS